MKPRYTFREGDADAGSQERQEPVGQAGHRVLLLHYHWASQDPRRKTRGKRDVSPGPDDHVWPQPCNYEQSSRQCVQHPIE